MCLCQKEYQFCLWIVQREDIYLLLSIVGVDMIQRIIVGCSVLTWFPPIVKCSIIGVVLACLIHISRVWDRIVVFIAGIILKLRQVVGQFYHSTSLFIANNFYFIYLFSRTQVILTVIQYQIHMGLVNNVLFQEDQKDSKRQHRLLKQLEGRYQLMIVRIVVMGQSIHQIQFQVVVASWTAHLISTSTCWVPLLVLSRRQRSRRVVIIGSSRSHWAYSVRYTAANHCKVVLSLI